MHPGASQNDTVFAFALYVFSSICLCLISTLMVTFGEPAAAGSGVPEVKGYLNGTNYLRFLRPWTGVVKSVAIIFSVSSGLVIGKVGVVIHPTS